MFAELAMLAFCDVFVKKVFYASLNNNTSDQSQQLDLLDVCAVRSVSCKTKAGEGAHMNRLHGQVHPVRTLITLSQCESCLTEYRTHGKLKAHLIRSHHCRQQLLGRGRAVAPLPGLGPQGDTQHLVRWDGRLPPLKILGPQLPDVVPRDFDLADNTLLEEIALIVVEETF